MIEMKPKTDDEIKRQAIGIIKTCDKVSVGLNNKKIRLTETMASFEDCKKAIDKAITLAKESERKEINRILLAEQFKGDRGYTEGCIKGVEAIEKHLKQKHTK